jgi:hypothetical protein
VRHREKPTPGTLGDVAPGDWATLEDGREVMVRWHGQGTPATTTVDVQGVGHATLWSSAVVTSVRKRDRTPVQGGEVDPLRMDS